MKCRYCGAVNPPEEDRCVKCQRLIARLGPLPVAHTAAVPAQAPQFKAPPAPQIPQVVGGTGAVAAKKPSQKPLFTSAPERVVTIAAPEPVRASTRAVRPKGAVTPNQAALDFGPPPPRLLAKEIDRSKWYPVAARGLRATAALFDIGFIIGFCILFAASVRITLGEMPWSLKTAPYWAGACLVVALLYKLAWSFAGLSSPGLRLCGLTLVSFDGYAPSPQQRVCRQLFGFFSLAAGGMGLIWALGDQETLTWHDHMSQTFLTDAQIPARR